MSDILIIVLSVTNILVRSLNRVSPILFFMFSGFSCRMKMELLWYALQVDDNKFDPYCSFRARISSQYLTAETLALS
jgi:hypothetical protein